MRATMATSTIRIVERSGGTRNRGAKARSYFGENKAGMVLPSIKRGKPAWRCWQAERPEKSLLPRLPDFHSDFLLKCRPSRKEARGFVANLTARSSDSERGGKIT